MEARAHSAAAAAFRVCVLASYDTIKAARSRAGAERTAGAMLAAAAWCCEGRLPRAEATLRRAVERASAEDRPYVVDLLVPLLIERGLLSPALALLEATSGAGLRMARDALRSAIDAASGARERSAAMSAALRDLLPRAGDDVTALRVRQHLALAASRRRDPGAAIEHVAAGLGLAARLGSARAAIPLHVTALAVHRRCTGDADAAWYHSGELERVARAGGDAARLRRASTIRFALAAERGDDGEMERLDPAQEPARIATVLAGALRHGWSGDFRAAGIALAKLDESPSASDGERALCGALLAVAGLALGDASGVRRFARRTTRVPVLAGGTTSADEQRRMRLARDLAAAVRAGTLLDAVPQSDRGYARFVRAAFECRDVRAVSATLSPTELRVLALVEAGKNAPQIAALLDRSAHTIRTHLRNIGTKLETHSRAESVARARRLGLLPP